MNRIMIQIFICLILSSLLGTVLYFMWKILGYWIEKKGYIDSNYWIWKIVLLSFICPVPFIVILEIQKNGLYGFEFWQADIIVKIVRIVLSIWIGGTIFKAIVYIWQHRKIYKIIKEIGYKIPEKEIEVKNICNELKIKKNIDLVILDIMKVPMVYGVIHPKILLPHDQYEQKELKIILCHEIIHYKHHDLLWKQLFQVVRCVYWFHPIMKDILKQIDQWGETSCDIAVSKYIKSVKEYFQVIIKIATEESNYGVYMAGLCEGTEIIMLRMQRMQKYLNKKPLRKAVSIGVIMVILGISSVIVMASSTGLAKWYNKVAIEVMSESEGVGEDVDHVIQRSENQREYLNKKNMIKLKEKIPKVDGVKQLDIKIKPKQRIIMTGRFINAKKGKEIEISVMTDLEEHGCDKIVIGIINEKNQERYIQGDKNELSDILWHGFEVKESGVYRIYIENNGEEERNITGYCAVNSYITLNKKGKEKNEENY